MLWPRALLAAFLLYLSHKGYLWGLFAWMALIPWFSLLDRTHKNRHAFGRSFCVGMLFYLPAALWMNHVTTIGYFFLCVTLSLYYGIFGWVYRYFSAFPIYLRGVLLAALWTSLEYLRSLGAFGFTWFFLGSSQWDHLAISQIVSLGGFFSLSFLIFWVNWGIYLWISKNCYRVFLTGIMLFVLCECYGLIALHKTDEKGRNIRVALIQANIAQDLKWDEEFQSGIYHQYQKLSLEAGKNHPDLIIWPESSIPGDIHQDEELQKWLSYLGQKTKAHFLIGANHDLWEQEGTITNAVFLLDPYGRLIDRYDKIHLVPFGEYIPLRKYFPWAGKFTVGEIDFSPGKNFHVFHFKDIPFSALLCFEDTLPHHVRKFIQRGARLLINLTNDAWFKDSSAAWEHFNLGRFTAIANGVNLVRVSNTGVSGIVSSRGENIKILKGQDERMIEVEGTFIAEVAESIPKTLYLRWGEWFSILCCAVVLLGLFAKMTGRVSRA